MKQKKQASTSVRQLRQSGILWAVLRISLGWIFLWAFLDKAFGLGYATPISRAWISGGSPTKGFLSSAVTGPLKPVFNAIAGSPIVDVLFMSGLLLIGLALILGIAQRLSGYFGVIMIGLIVLAQALPPVNNPFIDEHFLYIIILIGVYAGYASERWSFRDQWEQMPMVKKYPILK